ncbi:MAG: AAA family ATPase, partial [Anaerolineae bacterium]
MFIRHLELYNFRNYARLEIDLSARIHLLVGDNAQGKTNILEAIYYLATTRSPLAGQDRE